MGAELSERPAQGAVLIVEDEFLVADLVADILSSAGIEVLAAVASVGEAVAAAARRRPALALIDIRLAGAGDGVALARQLRAELGTPTLFLSGSSDPATRDRAASAGPLGFIPKPFRNEELVEAVQRALDQADPGSPARRVR